MSQVASLSDRLSRELPELLRLRQRLHAHPELSSEEHQTAALVAGELRQLGWRVREGVGRTGVVAELGRSRPHGGFAVDMDASGGGAHRAELCLHPAGSDACLWPRPSHLYGPWCRALAGSGAPLGARGCCFKPPKSWPKGRCGCEMRGRWKALMPCTACMWCRICRWARWEYGGVMQQRPVSWKSSFRVRVAMALVHQSVDAVWLAARVTRASADHRPPWMRCSRSDQFRQGGGRSRLQCDCRSGAAGTCAAWTCSNTPSCRLGSKRGVGICASGGFGSGELPLHSATVHNDPQLTTLLERCAVECLGRDKVLPVEQPSLGAEDSLSCFGMCRE